MTLDFSFIGAALLLLLEAIPTTLAITAVSIVVGFIIGCLVTLAKHFRIPVLSQLGTAYVVFIRGTPMLTHLLLIYAGLSLLIDSLSERYEWGITSAIIPMIMFAFISFSITAGAYMAEVIRSGMLSVDRGQLEAAYSIGMSTTQAMKRIVLPQALAASIPNLSNMVIGMLHGSTLAFAVSVVDINAKAQIIATTNWKFFEAYIAAALIFWGLTIIIEKLTNIVERKFRHHVKGGVA